MLKIKKTGEGYYMVTFANTQEELDRVNTHLIKKELTPIIKPHREVTIDVKGITKINSNGFKTLQDLWSVAGSRKCKIRFINVDPAISPRISGLSKSIPEVNQKIDIDSI